MDTVKKDCFKCQGSGNEIRGMMCVDCSHCQGSGWSLHSAATATPAQTEDTKVDQPDTSSGEQWIIKKRGFYYRPEARGYTANIAEAGRFSYGEAHDHMYACVPGEITIFPVASAAFQIECRNAPTVPAKVKSNGSSSDYYKLPPNASELRHLIQAKDMDFAVGNIFKACYRLGEKDGNDLLYDVRKMLFFSLDELEKVSGADYAEELEAILKHINEELARIRA